ncbi:MAG: MBL fold metallo-hydrolase [Acidimicrobiales bacterium]|nr:MBL fold metallo-hydrolase [Acidimicrobiales bacterium]
MADLLAQSARIVDTGTFDPGFNPMAAELHELADGVAMVDAFSHVVALDGGDGLVLFDVSHAMFGPRVVEALRAWRTDPVHTIVYTHGHLDHVGGAAAVIADNEGRGPRPAVVAHANVPVRFDRYVRTAGHNAAINARQFGGSAIDRGAISGLAEQWLTGLGVRPTTTYTDQLRLHVGDLVLDLHHGRGETDDHTWAWDAHAAPPSSATSSSGPSPTPATHRRCSTTRWSGPQPCDASRPQGPSCCCPRTGSRSPARHASSWCSATWRRHSSNWRATPWRS